MATETGTRDSVPTVAEVIERIDAIRPVLEGNRAKTEEDRRVAEENIEALRDAGVFEAMVPRRFGGYEMTLREKLEISAAVGESCGSTAWVVALANVGAWLASLLPAAGQEEIFGATPNPHLAGVLNQTKEVRKVDSGYVLSGKWPFASGSLHANWGLVGFEATDENGQVDPALAFYPMDELSIEDTWFVAGMKGSGSNTLVAEEAFVPEHRTYSLSKALESEYASEFTDEALYRSSFMPFLALVLIGPQIGLGRAALDFVIEKASRRGITYTQYEKQTESAVFQVQIAQAALLVETAELHGFRGADEIDAAAAAGEKLSYLQRTRARARAAYGIGKVREAIDLLLSAHGAASFADISPLQRIWRDSNTAGRHAIADQLVNEEIYGKALLGIPYEQNITPLI